ncbi:cyclopropane-fatty-acyl-phospholipid synthase family protein [Maritimibacter sp. DP4N28-5]|uniref:Cyclopropane-fatty-acyl-phospholipid synthase family protein n=2 Tax=Maritimibacter dapengensis TaxID=2836868 RepID=A0ABS6SXT9_9RHOB|nr:cyclopropane-fatty-acyl-phospholipid synthase family protein [Maritimibacter dapengensis]
MVARLVKSGDLEITWPDGTTGRYGDGTGENVHATISDPGLLRRLMQNPELALGEGYMEGGLTIEGDDLTGFLRLIARNVRENGSGRFSAAAAAARTGLRRFAQSNPINIARLNVEAHYDLPAELYELFLDDALQYTCAYFREDDMDIGAAQQAKMEHIGRKLMIEPGMRVLDIGSGWGGLSIKLAKEFGAQVTGVTLSDVQLNYAKKKAEEAGVADRVNFRLMDYRDLNETFDRVVVVGMLEHVGQPQYHIFFDQLGKVLAPDGIALVHTIGRTTPPGQTSPFIHKYIFPGGYIPALSEVMSEVEKTPLMPADIEVWRDHYARTMRAWQDKFEANLDRVREMFDERFVRMWRYYLIASEMSFTELGLVIFQLQMAHKPTIVPITREYLYNEA